MGKTKKLIELDDKAIKILEEQARLQKRIHFGRHGHALQRAI